MATCEHCGGQLCKVCGECIDYHACSCDLLSALDVLGTQLKPIRWHGTNIIWAGPFVSLPSVEESFDAVKRQCAYLLAENKRLRNALTIYADERNWLVGAGVVDWIRDSEPWLIAQDALDAAGGE